VSRGWSERQVLVTGATGLVGSWLVRDLLDRGAEVVCLVRDQDPQSELIRSGDINRTTVVQGRLEDYSVLERAINLHEVDTVFHLGAQTIVGAAHRSPLETFESNIRGTYHLLEACRKHRTLVERILVASSDKAYGTSDSLPYREEMPPLGEHAYDVSKACSDLLARSFHATYGLPVVIARCGNIYGGGDLNWSRIVPGTIRSLIRGERPIIRSDGRFLRDYVYVQDAVDAYRLMAEEADREDVRGEAFNFGPQDPVQVLTIVDRTRTLMERLDLEPRILDEAEAEIRDQYLSSEKAERVLGWEPRYSLDDGLSETIDWYRDYLLGGSAR
jgi:CDP-glucose 4,6-dehydratase